MSHLRVRENIYVKTDNGNLILAMNNRDADRMAEKVGGKVVRAPEGSLRQISKFDSQGNRRSLTIPRFR